MQLRRWARAVDALTVLLVLAALAVALTGGTRGTLLGARLSITSWTRLALWAGLLAALRHWLVPRPSLLARLQGWWALRPRHAALAAVLPALVVSRAAVLLVGLAAVHAFGFPEAVTPGWGTGSAANLLARYDTGWYLHIVVNGYRPSGDFIQQNIAFFPLYPLAVKALGELLGERWLLAGFLVSAAAFAGGLAYVFRLGCAACRRPEAPGLALALLAWYPFAVFYGAVYTEALFLLCAAGAFYHALRRQPLAAAGWGLAAGLTRPNGVLLAAPLAVVVALRAWPEASTRWRWLAGPFAPGPGKERRAEPADVLMVAAPAIGLAAYSAYIWRLTGDPMAWLHAQAAWGRGFAGLHGLVPDPFLRLGLLRALEHSVPNTLNGLAGLFALALAWPVARRLGVALGLFVALNVLVPMAAGGPVSLGRFTSVLFPMFLYLADRVPERHRPYWVGAFAIGQGLVAAMFFTWRELY